MSVTVLTDYPSRDRVRQLARRLSSTLVGGLLVFVSLVAALALIPVGFGVVGVLGGATHDELPFDHALVIVTAVGLIAVMIIARRLGLRMLRGNRELVLLLRRFGYQDATQVATFAATKTIGRSWRLVTLDDAAVTPVGVASGLTGLVRVVALGKRAGPKLVKAFQWIYGAAFWAGAAIAGLMYLQGESFAPLLDVLPPLISGEIPPDAFEPSLVGALAGIGVILALCLVAGAVFTVLLVASLFLMPLLVPANAAVEAAGAADQSKLRQVDDAAAIERVATDLEAASRKILAPRLVVLRVDSAVWQLTVSRLAGAGALTIIDVSEPTENLLWEVQELADRLGPRCVFIGHHDRVTELTSAGTAAGPLHERLLFFLDGREVLTYRTDRRSIRCFARALQAHLLDVSARVIERSGGEAPDPATDDLRRLEEELAGYDDAIARFGGSPEPAQRERVANALEDKAVTLARIGRVEEAVVAWDELTSRFGDSTEPALRGRVDLALAGKAGALAALGRHDERLAVVDLVLWRQANRPDEAPAAWSAAVLFDRSAALGALGRDEEALAVCDSVIARYADSTEPALRATAVRAQVNKAISLGRLGRSREACAIYDEVIERHRQAEEPALQMAVATALHKRYPIDSSDSVIGRLAAVRSMMRARSGRS